MEYVDLRSDTVTHPTQEMREAMEAAPVGDDVYGEDPTVNRLQEIAAEMTGKQAGLFVPSGTMGNLAAILAHCGRGDEVILGNMSHTFLYEAGGISALGGIHSAQLSNQPDGSIALDAIEAAIRPDDPHDPITRLICLEDTHNRCGGTVLPLDYLHKVGELARSYYLATHLDGARLFNAAIALGVPAKQIVDPFDSVTFCLSKALCAPVGSVICGTELFIKKVHRIRKQLGGGMRQVGILAAAGIVALSKMVDRLSEDHVRARKLANGLRQASDLAINPAIPETNMVFVDMTEAVPYTAQQIAEKLKELGVLVGVTGVRRFRLVTHYWINDNGVETAISAFQNVLK